MEGWLVGTSVVSGSVAYEGGGGRPGEAPEAESRSLGGQVAGGGLMAAVG